MQLACTAVLLHSVLLLSVAHSVCAHGTPVGTTTCAARMVRSSLAVLATYSVATMQVRLWLICTRVFTTQRNF